MDGSSIPPLPTAPLRGGRLRALARKGLAPATAFGMRIAAAAMAYLTFALIGRVTDVEAFSHFALVFSAVGFFGPVSTLGRDSMLLRNLPAISAAGDRGWHELVARCGRFLLLGIGLWGSVALAFGLTVLGTAEPALVLLLVALTASNGALEFLFAVQRGCGSVLRGVFSREILWRVVLLLCIGALWLTQGSASATALASAYLIALLSSMMAFLAYVVPRWIRARRAPPSDAPFQTRASAGAFFGLNLLGHAAPQIDTLLLGLTVAQVGPEIGAYFCAQRIVQILHFFAYGIAVTVTPRVPLAWQRGDTAEILRLSRQVSRGAGACVLLLSAGLVLFSSPLLGLFKPEFAVFGSLLAILAIGPVIGTLGGLHTVIAPMCGEEVLYFHLRFGVTAIATALKVTAGLHGSITLFAAISATEAALIAVIGVLLARRRLGAWPI